MTSFGRAIHDPSRGPSRRAGDRASHRREPGDADPGGQGLAWAEESLRWAEERYRAVTDRAPIGHAIVGLDDRWLSVNDALCEIVGYSREELLRMTADDITHPDDVQAQRAYVERLYGGEINRYEIEKRYVRPGGEVVWVRLTDALVRDAADQPIHFIAQVQDITQAKSAEQALRESEVHYRLLADNSTDWITIHNPTGRYLYVSPACRELLGREPEELLGTNPDDLVHPDDEAAVRASHAALLESTEPSTLTYRLRRRDGDYRWVETTSRSIRDPIIGEVRELQSTTRDVTRRMEAEARFRTAFEEAPIGMAMVGLDGRFISVNDTLCRILGYDRADLEGISVQDVTHHEDLEEGEAAARQLDAGQTDRFRGEQRYVHRDGRPVWVQLDLSVVRDAAGTPLHRLAQVQDITLRRDLEQELRRRADRDPLTGVPNRRRWDEELERELYRARRAGADLCVAVLDVDGFKPYNDTRGPRAGDRLLREAAGAWRSVLRATDVLARLGGDEFAVALPGTAEHDHGPIIDRLRRALPSGPTCSAGVASWNGIESAEALLERADQALSEAKRRGGDQTVLAARALPGA